MPAGDCAACNMFYSFALFVISCCCFVGNGVAAPDEWSWDCPAGDNIDGIEIDQDDINESNFIGVQLRCKKDGRLNFESPMFIENPGKDLEQHCDCCANIKMNFSGNDTILDSGRLVGCREKCYRDLLHFGDLLAEAGKGGSHDSNKFCTEDKNDCKKNSIRMSMSSYAHAGKRKVTSLSPISVGCYIGYNLTNIQITQMRGSHWLKMTLTCEGERSSATPSFLVENPGKILYNTF